MLCGQAGVFLTMWQNSKILMETNWKELVLCNPKDGTCMNFEVDGIQEMFYADTNV